MPSFAEMMDQAKKLYQDLTLRQRIVTASVLVLVMAGFLALFLFTNRSAYRVLYSDLSPEDAADVVNWLKNEKIPYQVANGGDTIKVPEDKVYDARLSLASAGLPKGGNVGFEIFDQTGLGVTDFVQHINYQRALQGELERTIERFPQVKTARVHLAQPKDSLFVTDRQEPTASVVLTLKRGRELNQTQVQGIVHLVASAVPRLSDKNVTVVDTSGRVLYENDLQKDELTGLTSAQLVYQRRLEEYYKHKIQSMLENVLGPNRAVARVSAEIDFDRVQISEDRYDPDTAAIRSEQKILETRKDSEASGIPGVKGGLASKLQGNLGQIEPGLVKTKEETTTNYEITRMQRQVSGSVGKLKRLSVAVLVDGIYKKEGEEEAYVPRSPEEMANLEKIVKAAMGFSEERGDEVSVLNVPFTAKPEETKGVAKAVEVGTKLLKPLSNLVLALLFIFLVIRPLLKKYVLRPEEETMAPLPGEEEYMEGAELPGPETFAALEPVPNAQEELKGLASDYPERAAALIKVWLREQIDEEKGGSDGQPASA